MIKSDTTGAAFGRLSARFPGRVTTAEAVRHQHSNTLSFITSQLPDCVIWAEATRDVVDVVEIAREFSVPIVAFGAGTSLEGHVNAPRGGICLDMSRMNAIKQLSPADLDCTVEAGVTRRQLNQHLRATGLFFRSIPAQKTPHWVAWRRRGPQAPIRFATER